MRPDNGERTRSYAVQVDNTVDFMPQLLRASIILILVSGLGDSDPVTANLSAAQAPAIDPPQPSTGVHPHEPAGLTEITDNNFDEVVGTGWTGWRVGNLSIVSDGAAPTSPSNVGAVLYRRGLMGGGGPVNLGAPEFSSSELYVHFAFKVSSNWYNHVRSNTTKIFFISNRNGRDSHNDIYLAVNSPGGPRGALTFQVRTQSVVAPGNYRANLSSGVVDRGRWYDIEMLLVLDSRAGAGDGQIHVWMNGQKTHEYRNAHLIRRGDDTNLNVLRWNPTYGGNRDPSNPVPADQYQYVDHIYMSGK